MRRNIKTAVALLGMAAGACSVGCGGKTSNPGEPTGVGRVELRRAASCDDLRQMLADDAIAKINAHIDLEIASIRSGYANGGGYFGRPGSSLGVGEDGTSGAAGSGPGADVGSGPVAPPQRGDSDEKASSHSDTNTQVAGVDEADIVKTDGTHLFLLHGQSLQILDAWPAASLAKGPEVAIEGQPYEMFVDAGRAVVYSSVDGNPIYEAAHVTPKSTYADYGYGYGYAEVGTAAPPSAGSGSTAGSAGSAGGSGATGPDVGMPEPYPGGAPKAYVPLTKVTVVALDGAAPAVTAELYFEGDYLSSRRVGDEIRTVLRGGAHGPAVQPYPDYDGSPYSTPSADDLVAAWEKLREKSIATIRASQASDWLPYRFVKSGTTVSATAPKCEEYYVPTAGSTRYGLTQLQVFDVTAPTDVHGASIVGDAETVYSNAGALYVAAASYEENAYMAASTTSAPAMIPSARTHLHKFDLASTPGQPLYAASGTVVGTIKDQFALDERDGYLRVATTEDRMFFGGSVGGDTAVSGGSGGSGGAASPDDIGSSTPGWGEDGIAGSSGSSGIDPTEPAGPAEADAGSAFPAYDDGGSSLPDDVEDGGAAEVPPSPTPMPAPAPVPSARPGSKPLDTTRGPSRVNHLFVLGQDGGDLSVVGNAGDLAPEERIYSTRFVGDRGYVVTFRQVDPLFVIDLSVPTKPTVVAELKIPGFSEYMHPLDDGHLLTIGKDTVETGSGGVRTNGLALQIFDVRDAKAPKLAHKYVFTDPYGSSIASNDHKAFTYFADRKLLAFPYTSFHDGLDSPDYGMHSTLEVFSIDTDAGMTHLGSIDHTAITSRLVGYCGGYYGVEVRRGVFLDDFIYSISYGGVIVNDVADLEHPVASLALSAPPGPAAYCGGGPGAEPMD